MLSFMFLSFKLAVDFDRGLLHAVISLGFHESQVPATVYPVENY